MKTRIKRALLPAALCAILAAACAAVRPVPASAATADRVGAGGVTECFPLPDYLGAEGVGTLLRFEGNGTRFVMKDRITVKEGRQPLVKLAAVPDERNNGGSRVAIGRFTLRFEEKDNPDSFFETTVSTDHFDAENTDITRLAARGPGQTFLGLNSDGTDLRTTAAGGHPTYFSLAGRRATAASSPLLSVEYDTENAAVYCSPAFSPYTDELRAMAKPYPAEGAVWAGFRPGAVLTVSVTADQVNFPGALAMLEVGGEPSVARLYADEIPKGAAGHFYQVPAPLYVGDKGTFEPFAGRYSVAKNGVASAEKDYSAGAGFTPEEAGEYEIEYRTGEFTLTVPLTVVESGDCLPVVSARPIDFGSALLLPGVSLPVGGTAESGLGPAPALTAEIRLGEAVIATLTGVTEDTAYTFEKTGTYTVRLTATDYVGRTAVAPPVTFTVLRSAYTFTGSASASDVWTLGGDDPPSVSPDDVAIYDYEWGVLPASAVTARLRKPGGDFEPVVRPVQFDRTGRYEVVYAYSFRGVTGEINRVVTVIDGTPPALVPSGPVANVRPAESETDRLYALSGLPVLFPSMTVYDPAGDIYDLGETVTLTVASGNTITDKTAEYKAAEGRFSQTLAPGRYVYRFGVTDGGGLTAAIVYDIEVRDAWHFISLSAEPPASVSTGGEVGLPYATVCDFYNAPAAGAACRVEIRLDDELYEHTPGGTFRPGRAGTYEITYVASSAAGELARIVRTLEVKDTTGPEITLSGKYAARGRLGTKIRLPSVSASDETDGAVTACLSVTLDGRPVNHYGGRFVPRVKGTYTVTVTAVDRAGNESVRAYEVRVVGNGGFIAAIVCGSAAGLALAALAIVWIVRRKKRVRADKKE